jgi:hypothetical protein
MPDEVLDETTVADEGQDVSVEVDREHNAPRLSDEQVERATNIPDDEIGRYAKDAQRRIRSLRTAFHDQRRRTEQVAREAASAGSLAEQLYRENQQLKQNAAKSDRALVEQAVRRGESELEHARVKARAAVTNNDPDEIVSSNEEVARAVAELDRLKLLRPAEGSNAEPLPQSSQPQQSQPQPRPASPQVKAWAERNPWFNTDETMTKYAIKQHQHLALDGITDESNPELYLRMIDERMREQFPDRFTNSRPAEGRTRPAAVTGGQRSNGAAPANGNGRARVVHLSESQLKIANRLGLTPEQYAADYVKYEAEKGPKQ